MSQSEENVATAAEPEDSQRTPLYRRESFPTILLFDDSTRSSRFASWIPDSVTVRQIDSLRAAREHVDRTASVAVVRHELSSSIREELADLLAHRAPHCRVVLATTERTPVSDDVLDQSACLTEPLTERDFRTDIFRQLSMVVYQVVLEQFYNATSQLASLEVKLNAEGGEVDDRYDSLSSEVEHLETRLEELAAHMDPAALSTILEEIASVPFPVHKPDGESTCKYRPDECRRCGLPWGRDANSLNGPGYERLGAFVWSCTECGTVHNRSEPANRKLARRLGR